MKAKNLFFGALACLAFAACSNDDDAVMNGVQAEGKAFIAVNLSMPEGASTRWDNTNNETNYKEGETYEVEVNDVKLYFFNNAGNSWCTAIDVNPTEWKDVDGDTESASDTTFHMRSDIVVALENVTESNYPTKVVAVLNGPTLATDEYATLELLSKNVEKSLNTIKLDNEKKFTETKGNFVMSNSGYYNGDSYVNYTTVTKSNFGTDKDLLKAQKLAIKNPVKIVVERVLARVSVDLEEGNKNVMTAVQDLPLADGNTYSVYAIANGWWLDQTNTQSNLVKRYVSMPTFSNWTNWNHPEYFRSYWAYAVNYNETDDADEALFQHYRYENAKYNVNDKYCYENTNSTYPTRLCVSANLYTYDGSSYSKVEDLIQWQYYYYNSIASFKTAVLSYLTTANEGASVVTKSGAALVAEDIKLVWNTYGEPSSVTHDYQAIVQLSAATGDFEINGVDRSIEEVNNHLKSVIGEFKYWNGGQTYYWTPIVHNADESLNGIIRNHLYKINVKSLAGLGTPVPSDPDKDDPKDPTDPTDPTDPEVPTDPTDPDNPDDPDPDKPIDPETPEDDKVSAIATEIVILEYRVVSQDVDLGK